MPDPLAPPQLAPPQSAPPAPVLGGVSPSSTPPAKPVTFREFTDVNAVRDGIYNSVFDAVKSFEPVSNATHTLSLTDPKWVDPPDTRPGDRKRAVLRNESLARRLRANWVLTDNATGQPVAARSSIVANVPVMTDGGTFVRDGVEYALAHQLRLRPGVYTRVRSSGETESHVNTLPGEGFSHRYTIDPASSVFKVEVGQSSVPLLPLLRAMGVGDDRLRGAWGDKLLAANAAKDDPKAIGKLYDRLLSPADREAHPDPATAVALAVGKMRLDPQVTARTLGTPHTHLTADAILDATKRMLAVYRGEAEPDDRDAMAYQKLMAPDDLLAERIRAGRRSARQFLWKATARKSLDHLPTGAFNPHVNDLFQGSGLASAMEEVNPSEIMGHLTRVTRLGEGGISGGSDAVPESSRDVSATQLGFVDPVITPESQAAGVDLRLAGGARRGSDGVLYSRVKDARTGNLEYKSALDLADHPLAFPGELASGRPFVDAVVGGRVDRVPRKDVRYELPYMEHAFSPLSNLVASKSAIKGQRASMGGRFLSQALALQDAEAPLVRSGRPDGPGSFEEHYGPLMGAVRSAADGRVTSVGDDHVTVRGLDGKENRIDLHHHQPFNRKSFLHQTPSVQLGQEVRAGGLLARSNYTDDKGHLALGKNLYTAYIPDGHNFEDAITVSQSAAKKMTSEHLYQHSAEHEDGVKRGKSSFAALLPSEYSRHHLSAVDEEGVIKPGTVVEHGQPLVLGARLKPRSQNRVLRGGADAYSNATLEWEHHTPGVVTDVEKTDKGVVVAVKAYKPAVEGDKFAARYGEKGLIKIVPDEHMPTDSQGKPFEMLLNPLGVQTRGNPAQVYEAVLGKIAKLTGKPYEIRDFSGQDLREFAAREADKHGVSDTDTVTDPRTGLKIPNVLTGYRHVMKLHHMAADKDQGRGLGSYTSDDEPARGPGDGGGAKRFSIWDTWALLSHGSLAGIRDAKLVRGQKNEDYWAMYQAGHRPPDPGVPHTYKKFVASLQAAGTNPVRQGSRTRLLGMTDKDVDQLTEGRELRNADTVHFGETLEPVAGGLFDPSLTGSHGGGKWTALRLHEPVLNPVFEEPARRLLGLTKDQLRQVIRGDRELNGRTGPAGLAAALKAVNVPEELTRAKAEFYGGKKTKRDDAVKRWALLAAAEKHGVHPGDWVLSKVPVLPPAFRPVSLMQQTGRPMTADANLLYKELYDANENLKSLSAHSDQLGAEREAVYDAFKGVVGLGDPVDPKNRERGVTGILKGVFGSSPKYGMLQRKLLGASVDTVGRSVIVPNSDLDMDQAGLPEDKAWDVFKPFVVRRLVRQGLTPLRAAELIDKREALAGRALQDEMAARPVQITRAPVLHRYSTMAFRPVLVKGHAIHLPPVVYKGYGADNDGDQVNYHVPASDDAVREALERMLPSRNLFNVRKFAVHQVPQNEFTAGLYEATHRDSDTPPVPFASAEAVVRALRRGEIRHDQRVTVPS